MIDANDKATQALDLGEQKKRRGRPATGKAMTNAERQRAYRERKKAAARYIEERAKEGKLTELEAYKRAIEELCNELEKAYAEIKRLKGQE